MYGKPASDFNHVMVQERPGGGWFSKHLVWLLLHGYTIFEAMNINEEQIKYNSSGIVIGSPTQAKEAQPKVVPPLWDDREV